MIKLKYLILTLVGFIFFVNCGTENTPTFEMSIFVNPPEAGTVISSPNQTVANQGTSYSLGAIANEGWLFSSWGGDELSTVNPLIFTLDSDKSIIANFEAKSYPLTVIVDGEGTVIEEIIAQPKTTDYEHGTLVRLTAKPADGWQFQEWVEYPDSSDTIDLHITQATSVSVKFKLNPKSQEEFFISTYSVSNFDGYNSTLIWAPTVDLKNGQEFTITATKSDSTLYSPNGWGKQGSSVLGYELGTLVGSIGDTGNHFKVGSNYIGQSPIDGKLYLVVDIHVYDHLNDKDGLLIVTIEY